MIFLISGLIVWCAVHFIPSLAISFKQQCIANWGLAKYRIVFSVLMVLSIGLMVVGWRSVVPMPVYAPPVWGAPAAGLLVLIGFVLMGASHAKTNLKRVIRHPQLTGVIAWGVGHLLANGDIRSVTLFCSLTAWAAVEILLINRRDGAWVKPGPVAVKSDLRTVAVGIVIYIVVLFAHPYLFGVSPMPH